MYDWALALVAIALVAGVLGFSVLSASAVVESRVLVVGFLAFFAASLIAGAGLVPMPTADDEANRIQSAYLTEARGGSR